MNNFRKPRKKKNTPKSVDGFIPNMSTIDSANDIKKRFRKSYKPINSQALTEIKNTQEGFGSRNNNIDGSTPKSRSFDLLLDDAKPSKRRFFGGKKKKSFIKRLAKGAGIALVALVLAIGALFGYGVLKARQIFRGNGDGAIALQKNVDPSRLNGEGDGRVNILLLGKGGPGHEAPDLTDTILLASIDPVQNEAALLSIPRDLYVQDEFGVSSKINAVYSNAKQRKLSELGDSNDDRQTAEDAGLRAVKNSVSDVIGVPVHYYVMVNFKAFEQAIDTVGGITVDVPEPLYDSTVAWLLGGNPLVADKGLQAFDGERALLYARSRKGSARGDFDRTERQRSIIVALQNKVLNLGTFSNPFKVLELLNAFGSNVRTDLNGVDEIKRLYEISQNIGSDRIISVGLADPPNVLVSTDFIGSQSVVVPVEGLYQYDEIRSYVRNTLRDAFLKLEDAKIVIKNGAGVPGLASAKEKELKSYGYTIIDVSNAPTSDFTTTRLIDLSGGDKKYTKRYLENRLGVISTETIIDGLPSSDIADFVIILGSDEAIKTTN